MSAPLLIVYESIKIMAIVHVLMDNRQPAKTMAWMLVIYFMPVVGLLFYFFFGRNTRREKLMSQRSLDQLTKRSMLEFVVQQDLHVPENHRVTVDLFANQNFCLPFKDNEVEIFTDGHSFFLDLISTIGNATQSIHIDMYIFEDDSLGNLLSDVLIDKSRKGVEVRKMKSKLLKTYNGFTIVKSWELKSDGTTDKDSVIYSAYDSDGDLVTASNNLTSLKKELR